jgi:hypothetical protein
MQTVDTSNNMSRKTEVFIAQKQAAVGCSTLTLWMPLPKNESGTSVGAPL